MCLLQVVVPSSVVGRRGGHSHYVMTFRDTRQKTGFWRHQSHDDDGGSASIVGIFHASSASLMAQIHPSERYLSLLLLFEASKDDSS